MRIVRFLVLASLLVGFRSGWASVITFDNLTDTNLVVCTGGTVPNGEGGLNWNNFGYLDASMNICSAEGYGTALASAPNVGFNVGGDAASITSAVPFTLLSADFAAAWSDGLMVTVTAKSGSNVVGTDQFVLTTTTQSLITFDFGLVTELDFSSAGGAENANLVQLGGGSSFAFDNLTLANPDIAAVPEPGMMLEFVTGLAMLLLLRRRPLAGVTWWQTV